MQVTLGGERARGYVVPGIIAGAVGKSADIALHGPGGSCLVGRDIGVITTIGRDEPTHAQKQRGETVLCVLQGNTQILDDNPWVKKLCFPSEEFSWPSAFSASSTPLPPEPDFSALARPPNNSQVDAVKRMLSHSDESRITLIHGPPGTGKTTVIATYVHFALSQGQGGIWLTAQSNVAVKNIAEKLSDTGFTNYKLLVSKDFHFEWYALIPSILNIILCFMQA